MRIRNALAVILTTAALVTLSPVAHADTVRPVVVTPHRVVIASRVPHCTVEDGSTGPVPCSWNLHRGQVDGNGRGLAYYLTGTHAHTTTHYVWPSSPVGDQPGYRNPWHWITAAQARILSQPVSRIPTAHSRLWTACVIRTEPEAIRCADGFLWTP